MRELIRHLIDELQAGRGALVCQVVETRGSTPQKAGALMIVRPDGGQVGTLGGGCVEAEVKQKAIRHLDEPDAALHSYVLDHDYAWADGLICGGKMVVLSQYVRGPEPLAYYRRFSQALDGGSGLTELVALDPARCGVGPVGARFVFDATGKPLAAWPEQPPPPSAAEVVPPLVDRPRPRVTQGLAALPMAPRVRLVIAGAGHVGQAVAALAAQADFDVWIVDDRAQYANRDRFPDAAQILVGPFDEVLPALEITPQTYAVIVTRGHGHDQEVLGLLAPTAASYVGLIGSRRKIRMIFDALRESGVPTAALDRVAAPVGLDIGSESVPEIAVSIVAELIARRNLGAESLRRLRQPAAAPPAPVRPGQVDPL